MANFTFNEPKKLFAQADLDILVDDIRVGLFMTNTTLDTEDDVDNFSAATTVDEYDGSAYVNKALANRVVNEDAANNRAEFDADDVTWTALGAGTRQAQGLIIYKAVAGGASATAANRIPICWVDTGGFPFLGNGGDIVVVWNSEGVIQFA